MRFYSATSRFLPRHYAARMFALSFSAVHIPLIAFLVFQAARGEWSWSLFVVLLVATVIGSAVGIAGIAGLLSPVKVATDAMRALRDDRPTGRIPVGAPDMAGELLESVAHAVRTTAQRMEALEELAETDMLTGLSNRRGLHRELERLDYPGGVVIVFDANDFKSVNDDLGHAEGDRVLRGMADRLLRYLGTYAILARWGGDEFLAYIPGERAARVQGRMAKFARSLRTQPLGPDRRIVTFSIGAADVPSGHPEVLEGAIRTADRAMYQDKRSVSAMAD